MEDLIESLDSESLSFVEELYQRYLEDPTAVPESWRDTFAGLGQEGSGAQKEGLSLGPSFQPSSIFDPPSAVVQEEFRLPEVTIEAPPTTSEVSARIPFLSSLLLFKGVPEADVTELAKIATEVEAEDGQHIFRQGDPGEGLYVVLEGSVVIWRDGELVVELGVGEVVGELGVLDHSPRIADAIACGHVRLLRLRSKELLERLDRQPAMARGVIRGLTRRLRGRGSKQHKVDQLVRAYRVRGHLLADLNPLEKPSNKVPELELQHWGLSESELDTRFASTTIPGSFYMTLRQMIQRMEESYCGSIAIQYMHLDDVERKDWLQWRLEDPAYRRRLTVEEQRRILTKLTDAEIFEQFIHKKFLGAKRFSAEGAETLIPLLDQVIQEAASQGVKEVVIGMAHRGRLNVLANILGKSPAAIFREFADQDAERYRGRGDVKYHLGYSTDREFSDGRKIHLSLCFNPSHLEFVGPVVLGRVRAKQERTGDTDRRRGMGLVVHGDAAFAGQGVVQELLNMSALEGYGTGGALHLIVNNQIGFTTTPESGRSSHYATDVAKLLQTPIFHVNGEHPEAVAQVIRIAMAYRQEFDSDVIIDMYCYRRYGHNEGDEPAFTQPDMYRLIRQRKSVREGFLDSLLPLGGVTAEEAKKIAEERGAALDEQLARAREPGYKAPTDGKLAGIWAPFQGGADRDTPEASTAVNAATLSQLLQRQTEIPEGFTVHPRLAKTLIRARRAMAQGEKALDWGAGEAIAFASLLVEGHPVRLSGQDCGRGTFSHRHSVLHDSKTAERYLPLNHLSEGQARYQVWDSPLSEIGPLGFEYGYSLDNPEGLVIWEAQFGDFVNAAQVIIDQFISSSEDKWNRLSGLVMFLPHGFEGQGPEHSSARLERFLTLCAEDNMQVVNLTTPAQLYHCLRRQVLRPLRKPLIVMSPKSLLRHPQATSSLEDLSQGGFQRLIPDRQVQDSKSVRRILLCSGKVYFDLASHREEEGITDVAIVRLEQYYPLSLEALEQALAPFSDGTPVLWVQEEPANMGALVFLKVQFGDELLGRWPLSYLGRPASASPATGSAAAHKQEQAELVHQAFEAE
ncbi:MAG: 2-oxoglutarate dehydrogenase E1 component [Deltaproteobacteria bacterium]|nr:2-oxoglutarate dehydrogenase E1 component [Deltaproteobacteria bacterium]